MRKVFLRYLCGEGGGADNDPEVALRLSCADEVNSEKHLTDEF
jgi:hypothetical protein